MIKVHGKTDAWCPEMEALFKLVHPSDRAYFEVDNDYVTFHFKYPEDETALRLQYDYDRFKKAP